MIRAYVFLNLLLGAVAVIATAWVLTRDEPSYEPPANPAASAQSERNAETAPPGRTPARSYLSEDNVQVLWEDVLFHPDRQEGVSLADETGDDEQQTGPTDMELIGVGVVAEQAAAVILVNESQSRRGPRNRSATTKTQKTQHVYKRGATVEETGYIVKEITLNEVVLTKGDEERVLRLTTGDAASQNRITAAARQQKEARQNMTRSQPTIIPPPPPPAPPPPSAPGGQEELGDENGGQAEDANEMTKEERIRRALERRRELIERLRKARSQNPPPQTGE